MRWLVVFLVGCYSPTIADNVPCGRDRACPEGQVCNAADRCVPEGTLEPDAPRPVDAFTAIDAPLDAPALVAPTLRGFSSAPSGMSITVMSPPGTMPGDLLLAHVTQDGANADVIVTPAGWTRLVERSGIEDVFGAVVFHRFATAASESFTFTFTDGLASVHLMAFGGVHATSPIDASAGNALAATSQPTAPSITTTRPRTRLVVIYTLDLSTDTFQPVTGMSEIYDQFTMYLQVGASHAEIAMPSATGDRVAMRSGNDPGPTVSFSIALAPR